MSALGDLLDDLGGKGIEIAGLAMFPGNAVANALTAINASVGARSIDALLAQDQEAEQQQNRRGESKDEHDALPPPPQNDFAPARFSAG